MSHCLIRRTFFGYPLTKAGSGLIQQTKGKNRFVWVSALFPTYTKKWHFLQEFGISSPVQILFLILFFSRCLFEILQTTKFYNSCWRIWRGHCTQMGPFPGPSDHILSRHMAGTNKYFISSRDEHLRSARFCHLWLFNLMQITYRVKIWCCFTYLSVFQVSICKSLKERFLFFTPAFQYKYFLKLKSVASISISPITLL